MKFKGEPGLLIRDVRKKKVYRFDQNGFFETDDPRLAKRMSARFETVETIQPLKEGYFCPKCGREFKNASGLSAHTRTCKGA